MTLVSKPLTWFHPDPNQPRKTFDEAELRALGESMKVMQLQPVVAKPDGTVLCGGRRVAAAHLVGIKELLAIIADKPLSDSEVKVIQLTENIHRADLSAYDRWGGCCDVLAMNAEWTLSDLADHLKLDPSMVTRLMSPSKCIREVQESLKAGKIGISDCYAISRLPKADQAGLLALKLSGASRDAIESKVRRKRNCVPAVRVSRIKIAMPGKITLVVSGQEMNMAELVDVLSDVTKEARKVSATYDVKTWMRMMADRARAS
jgi:ParB family chromosome partitioning protein